MFNTDVNSHSDFLFSRPSFLEGVARVFDFFGILQEYNSSSSPQAADERAIRADWEAVGDDMRMVMIKFSEEELD